MRGPRGRRLPGAEDAVAGVAQSRHDVALVVQLLVDRRREDGNVRVGAAQLGDAFRRRHQADEADLARAVPRSEEHTSELQSLMRISYAVFCLKKKRTSVIKEYP